MAADVDNYRHCWHDSWHTKNWGSSLLQGYFRIKTWTGKCWMGIKNKGNNILKSKGWPGQIHILTLTSASCLLWWMRSTRKWKVIRNNAVNRHLHTLSIIMLRAGFIFQYLTWTSFSLLQHRVMSPDYVPLLVPLRLVECLQLGWNRSTSPIRSVKPWDSPESRGR